MKKIDELFKTDGMSDGEYEIKKRNISFVLYFVMFIAIVIFVNVMPSVPESDNSDKFNSNDEVLESDVIIDYLNKVEDNYSKNVSVKYNLDIYELEMEVKDEVLGFVEKYGDVESSYIYKDNKYYVISEDSMDIKDEHNMFYGIDLSMTDSDVIVKLIELSKDNVLIHEDGYDVYRYSVSLGDVLSIYNGIYSSDYGTSLVEDIIINVNYDEEIKGIVIDYSSLYKIIDSDIREVIYNFNYSNIGEISFDGIDDVIESFN